RTRNSHELILRTFRIRPIRNVPAGADWTTDAAEAYDRGSCPKWKGTPASPPPAHRKSCVVFKTVLAALLTRLPLSNTFSRAATPPLTAADLRCEYRPNPLGIDVPRPRLSWKLQSDARGVRQHAYHILVASSLQQLNNEEGDLWDSGKIESDQSVHVE